MRSASRTELKRWQMSSTRPARGQRADLVEQVVLGPGVERGGRLVEDEERRVAEEGPGQGDPLPLPDRQVAAAGEVLGQQRVVAGGQLRRGSRRAPAARAAACDRVVVGQTVVAPEADVLPRREPVAGEVLEDDGDLVAAPTRGRRRRGRRRPR